MDYGTYDPASAQDMLTDVVPSQPQTMLPMARRARLLKLQQQAAEMEGAQPDVSQLQEFARMQGQVGEASMLNALAAQYAGEQFQPVQAQFLKRAMAAQEPMKIGGGMLTPDGKFIRDPFAAQERGLSRLDRLIQSEQGAITAEEREQERRAENARREQERKEREAQRIREVERDYQLRQLLAQNRMQNGGGAQPYFQPMQTAQGIMAFNTRTGRMELISGVDGKPIIGSASDPTLQGQISGAKTAGTTGAQSAADARTAVGRSAQMLDILSQAEQLLKQNPTQSKVGALRDAAGNLIGVSSESADTAAQLESISGWLTANVPRMEGPQSNFDVQNYQMMSGMVGDRTKPVSQRLAALSEIRKLQEKYRAFNEERAGPAPGAATQPKKRIRFDSQGNEIP